MTNSNSFRFVTKIDNTLCQKFVNTQNTPDYYLVNGDTWYNPAPEAFYSVAAKKHGRVVKAGPSGSTFMWMNFVFNLLHFERTLSSHKMLLACIIADFVPYFHSLNEVLFVFSRECEYAKPYTIDQSPSQWLLDFYMVPDAERSSRKEIIDHIASSF